MAASRVLEHAYWALRTTGSPTLLAMLSTGSGVAARIAIGGQERWRERQVGALLLRGDALLRGGDASAARRVYERALAGVASGHGRWVFRLKHHAEFRLERVWHRLGQPRVEDPLFSIGIERADDAPPPREVVGAYDCEVSYYGLQINGIADSGAGPYVDILLNGTVFRRVNLEDGSRRRFNFQVKRSSLAGFPATTSLTVRGADGSPLAGTDGGSGTKIDVPHGDGSLLDALRSGARIDKKGELRPPLERVRETQQRYLSLYVEVDRVMQERFGRPLTLMYGTLLGAIREGDFIPGDDDFDAGYVSDHRSPEAVKGEAIQVIMSLLGSGYDVSFNSRGRLFRVQSKNAELGGIHLDLRPIWFADGNLWVHNHVSFPCQRDAFLPFSSHTLRGVQVHVPRDPQQFLEAHYGPGWKVPDPGFTYHEDQIDPKVRSTLARALITPDEHAIVSSKVEAERANNPDIGRFISIGSQPLYPLDELVI